jgi:uncharacterized LabA/DUF88 family protein
MLLPCAGGALRLVTHAVDRTSTHRGGGLATMQLREQEEKNRGHMASPLFLVDFENVQTIDVQHVPDDWRIAIFYGANQKSAPLDLTARLQALGTRVQWHGVTGSGQNALDFHIAFHIGRILERKEASELIILTKDTGYDPLVEHIRSLGVRCKRVAAVRDIQDSSVESSRQSSPSTANASRQVRPELERVRANLSKLQKNKRPRKHATLAKPVNTLIGNKLTQAQLAALLNDLFVHKLVSETNDAISYHC